MSFVERSPAELIAAGTAALNDGRPAEAAELFARAAALRPGDARLAYQLGLARHRAHGPEAALAAFRAAEAVAGRMRGDAAAPDLAMDLADGATSPATFRALVAMPHHCRADRREKVTRKARALERVLDRLCELYSPRSWTLDGAHCGQPANAQTSTDLDVVILTTGEDHALDQLEIDASLFQHQPTGAEPEGLGYEAHRLIWETAGRYDFVLYLEDDVLLTDPDMFHKLRWFNQTFGSDYCLHPRAFESTLRDGSGRVYVRGEAGDEDVEAVARAHFKAGEDPLVGWYAGRSLRFVAPDALYAGCFALSGEQALMWCDSPHFMDGDMSYGGPRRSAAGLGLAKCFDLRQPHADDAGFFHVRRQGDFQLRQHQAHAVGARAAQAVAALSDPTRR